MPDYKAHPFAYLLIFLLVIIILIVFAVILRSISEVNNSSFKNNSYSLLIVSKDSKLIYVDKEENSALFLALGDIQKYVNGKSPIEITFALGIPINGILYDDTPPKNLSDFSSYNNETDMILRLPKTKVINRLDIHKIASAVRNSNKDNIKESRVDIFNQETMKDLEDDFIDSQIRNSRLTVEVSNGTTINGLGSLFALILAKQGYNVISVKTAKPELTSYIAYEGERNTYIDSLVGITGFEFRREKVSKAADVTIYLGEDLDAMLLP